MAERLDAIYPRVGKALRWGAERYGIGDYCADTEETRAAEALFNARLNDYAQGGDEQGVKAAVDRLIKAHARRTSDKAGRTAVAVSLSEPGGGTLERCE